MPEGQPRIVVNTGPLLALVAATGGLDVLRGLYCEILVPREVHAEILAGGADGFGVDEVGAATWLTIWPIGLSIEPLVRNALDLGEASVVQLALNEKIELVCIDEAVGRRVARMADLKVTGSIGILLRAIREGRAIDMEEAIGRMTQRGVWLSPQVRAFAIRNAKALQA
jgi:predicted nucleic acid-binding protein